MSNAKRPASLMCTGVPLTARPPASQMTKELSTLGTKEFARMADFTTSAFDPPLDTAR